MGRRGTLTVRVIGETKDVEKAIGRMGKKFAAFGAAVVAAGAAVGKGLFEVGKQIDSAFDTIRVGTGATGDALAALQDDFRAVAKTTPSDMADVGTAIADLNTRLGLTGKPLQDISKQFLNLSRITKTDLSTNIAAVTRVFGDFAVATEDQSGAMDELFRVSQATGIGVSELADQMVTFGAPLRQMGFEFEQSAALIAKFEKEGVNTQAVLGGMKIALGKMAQAGEEPIETFARLTEEIANAGSTGEANAIAVEAFGTRAGPDLAAAVREGRFELSDYLDVISSGSDTINKASSETEDFAEKWQTFKNRVLLKLEPVAMRVFEAIEAFAEEQGPKVERFLDANLGPAIDKVRKAFKVMGDMVGFVVDHQEVLLPLTAALTGAYVTHKAITTAVTVATKAWALAQGVLNAVMAANPIGLVVVAIAALTAAVVTAWKTNEGFRDAVRRAFEAIVDAGKRMAANVIGALRVIMDFYLAWADKFISTAAKAFGWVPGIGGKLKAAAEHVKEFRENANDELSRIQRELRFSADVTPAMRELARLRDALRQIPGAATVTVGGTSGGLVMHSGGVVPGRRGQEVPAILEAGETVIPADASAGVGGVHVTVNAPNFYGSADELASAVADALVRRRRAGGPALTGAI